LRKRPLSGRFTDIRDDEDLQSYFRCDIRLDDTQELCKSIQDHNAPKAIAYLLLVMFLLFVVPHKQIDPASAGVEVLKAWGVFSTFAILLVWDYALCLHQRRQNDV
jgi:hypothetical protein